MSMTRWAIDCANSPCKIEDAFVTCTAFDHILQDLLLRLTHFMKYLLGFYIHFEVVAYHLLSNGFVNAIPDYENGQESAGDGKFDGDSTEPSGMGEGDTAGATDVGDQIENMEQIEGLKVF